MVLYRDIIEHLKTKIDALRYLDEDWGQLDAYADHPPVAFPCLLVDMLSTEVHQRGAHVMHDNVTLCVRVADWRFGNGVPADRGDKSKQAFGTMFDLLSSVSGALHGWTGHADQYTPLMRVSEKRIRRTDGIRMYEIIFATTVLNKAAVPQYVYTTTPPTHSNIHIENL